MATGRGEVKEVRVDRDRLKTCDHTLHEDLQTTNITLEECARPEAYLMMLTLSGAEQSQTEDQLAPATASPE